MTLNLTVPNFSVSNLNDSKDLYQVKSFLIQLSNELQMAMRNIDDDNLSDEYKQYISGIKDSAGQAVPIEKVEEIVTKTTKDVIDIVNQTAYDIQLAYEHLVTETETEITNTMAETYSAKSDVGDLEQRLSSSISQNSTTIENRFTEANDFTSGVNSDFQSFKEIIEGYQTFTADGMLVGKSDSPFKILYGNEKISFLKDSVEIAYMMGTKLYITEVEISYKLSIGNTSNGFFEIVPRANGNVDGKWRVS